MQAPAKMFNARDMQGCSHQITVVSNREDFGGILLRAAELLHCDVGVVGHHLHRTTHTHTHHRSLSHRIWRWTRIRLGARTCALVRIRRPDRANAEPTFSEVAFICHYRCAHTGGEDHRQLRSDYGAGGAYRHDVVGAGHVAIHLDDWFERKHVGALLPVGFLDWHLLHVIGHEWRQGGACCQG